MTSNETWNDKSIKKLGKWGDSVKLKKKKKTDHRSMLCIGSSLPGIRCKDIKGQI